jgi:hypothetical protein
MTPGQIKQIRKLTGRSEANIDEVIDSLANYKRGDNYALRCIDWADLCAVLLSTIEAHQAELARVKKKPSWKRPGLFADIAKKKQKG